MLHYTLGPGKCTKWWYRYLRNFVENIINSNDDTNINNSNVVKKKWVIKKTAPETTKYVYAQWKYSIAISAVYLWLIYNPSSIYGWPKIMCTANSSEFRKHTNRNKNWQIIYILPLIENKTHRNNQNIYYVPKAT